jgi:hypothetical protein
MFRLIIILISCLIAVSCSSVSPHENFKQIIGSKIGMNIDSPPEVTGINPNNLISSTVLQNGNLEKGYLYRETCKYFFEVDQRTHNIVGWRFEGNEHDCEISP